MGFLLGKRTTYLGNPNLKAAGVSIPYTKEQVDEYMKCAEDPLYFIENYVYITHVDKGIMLFKLRDYQKTVVQSFVDNRFTVCKFPRQAGKSSVMIALFLWYILFNSHKSVAILANKEGTAKQLLKRLKLSYENLPFWLQQGVETWNKKSIELENGSLVLADATSSDSIRGYSLNIVFLDEFAHVGNNIAQDFFSSVFPTISSGVSTKIIIVSTPNGLNHFYKIWSEAEEKQSEFEPIEVHWSEVPGRDTEWMISEKQRLGERLFQQEHECDFLGSAHTLIPTAKLKSLVYKQPLYSKDGVDIYERPKKDHLYIITVDPSEGKKQDFHAMSVIDISSAPYRQVAKFRDNEISPLLLPNIIYKLGKDYNDAYVMIELNKGQQIVHILHWELEYENLLMTAMKGRKGQVLGGGFGTKSQMGLLTTKASKRDGCHNLRSLMEEDQLSVIDYDTIYELFRFVAKRTSYEAEEGENDDLVTTLWMFAWIVSQEYFKELTDIDIRAEMYSERMKQIDEELTPFGFIDDGTQDNTFFDNEGTIWETVG